jgi:aryl-alcohol dehydrogenase-like predicted oxidoreductase
MEYRILGRTGLNVSVLGVGMWQLSGPLSLDGKADGFPDVGKDKAIALIHACGDLGINFIDAAEIYGGGEGERRVGEAIRGKRDRWIVSTKFGIRRGSNGERITNAQPDTIRASLENSLKRLQTDYVDIYLYHCEPDSHAIAEGKEVLDTLKQEGKLRFYGISTDNPTVLSQMVARNAVDVVMFNQSLVTHPSELLDLVKKHNLGTIIRGALEAGLLSGKYFQQNPQFSAQDVRQQNLKLVDFQRYGIYKKFLPEGVSMTAFALRYLLDLDSTHTIALGGKSIEQYRDALGAIELPPLESNTHEALQKVRQQLLNPSIGQKILNRVGRLTRQFVKMR